MDMMLDITKESIIASGYTLRSFEVADVSVSGWELPCYLAECSFSSMMYTSHFFTVQTYFVSEEYLVFLSSFADDLSTAKEALQHLFWL